MVAVFLILSASMVQLSIAANCNGGSVQGKLIYNATRQMDSLKDELVICSYNLCKALDIKIDKIETGGTGVSCKSGGVGDYFVETNVAGGDKREFNARIWASGPGVNEVTNPQNPYVWGCYIISAYQNQSYC